MSTKLQAADVARRAGIDVIIAAGRESNIITRLISGETLGTRFPAVETPLDHWKRWIFAGPTPSGSAIVDDGASRALRRQNSSLLPSGILAMKENLNAEIPFVLSTSRVKILARGITRYSQHELHHIKGCHSTQIVERLGYTSGAVIVHRRDMILT
jgi:glutamate 5-kinase